MHQPFNPLCLFAGFFLILLCEINVPGIHAQDNLNARKIISDLSSERMHGRGYSKNGDRLAADYIVKKFQKIGLRPFTSDYYQYFDIHVNTFPGRMKLSVNGKMLKAGEDFLVDASSPGARGKIITPDFVFQDKPGGKNIKHAVLPFNGRKITIEVTPGELTFTTSTSVSENPGFTVRDICWPDSVYSLGFSYKNRFRENYRTQNIAAFVPGSDCPDSLLVFTAHYDHLGLMGKRTFFPGANDNASGIAMLISLADYFATHPPRFSVAFLAFSGEEAGLLGSGYFVNHPLFPLAKVKFLVNLDLVGTGDEGITVVNGSVYTAYFSVLTSINEDKKDVLHVKPRGEACNSDHCLFHKAGVPSFYIYTLGGSKAYHDIGDRAQNLSMVAFGGLMRLLIDFSYEL